MVNRSEIKAKLIELRFWRANEIGDPTLYREDAQQVRARIQHNLANDTFFSPRFAAMNHVSTKIVRYDGEKRVVYDLAAGEDFQQCAANPDFRLSKAVGLGI